MGWPFSSEGIWINFVVSLGKNSRCLYSRFSLTKGVVSLSSLNLESDLSKLGFLVTLSGIVLFLAFIVIQGRAGVVNSCEDHPPPCLQNVPDASGFQLGAISWILMLGGIATMYLTKDRNKMGSRE